MRRSKGFTLIELVAVLALAAVLAGAAVLSLQGPYQAAQLENAVERLVLVDRQLRDHARQFERPARLTLCPNTGRVAVAEPGSETAPPPPFHLDGGVRIDQVAVGERRSDCDAVTIAYSRQGRSTSFAVRLRGADQKRHWLLFVGGTGQMIRLEEDKTIEELLRLGSTPGTDAG